MALLKPEEITEALKALDGWTLEGQDDPQAVHLPGFSRGGPVRQRARAGRRRRRPSSRHRDPLQARDPQLLDARSRAASPKRISTARRWPRRSPPTFLIWKSSATAKPATGAKTLGPSQMKLKKLYSSREVAQLTGLTARQLQWWAQAEPVSSTVAVTQDRCRRLHRAPLYADRIVGTDGPGGSAPQGLHGRANPQAAAGP